MARFPTKNLIKPVVVSVADEQAAQALLAALPDSEWLAMMQLCIRNAIELGMLHPRNLMAAAWEADPADALEYIRSRQSEPDEDDD